MNYNFADWEIIQFLPKNNTFSKELNWIWYDSEYFLYFEEKQNLEPELSNYHNVYKAGEVRLKDAWTWEDIRLYLESKGYYLGRNFDTNSKNAIITVWYYKEGDEGVEIREIISNSYEDARKQTIIYCLNLIKENE